MTVLLAGSAALSAPLVSLATSHDHGGHGGTPVNPPGTNTLRIPPAYAGGMLMAEARKLELWPGTMTDVLALNGTVPGPTIRVTKGGNFSAHVMNLLGEPLVLHWHGILAPASQDGHPRDAIAAGQSAMIGFPVNQQAGTYWYHAHTDMLTGKQAYLGLAGLFIVEDPAEAALGLPTGDHDVPLLLADRRPDANKQLPYAPTMMEIATGWLGTEVLANGTPSAVLSVDTGLYRLRLVNASNARVLKVGLSDNSQFQLIANDAGLLSAPVAVSALRLAPGGRAEILISFAGRTAGSLVKLVSHPFDPPAGHGGGHGGGATMTGPMQGTELDLLTFVVDRLVTASPVPPVTLVRFAGHDPMQARRTRQFSLGLSHDGRHQINGMTFSMQRVDFTVPKGELEIWEFTDTTGDFHPMHPHAAQFQVLSRSSAAVLPPEDTGWKDTVLVNPMETVRVLVRFDAHEGVFVQHCHNLEHEDDGMMQNFEVRAGAVVEPTGPPLQVEQMGDLVHVSWPMSAEGYQLQARSGLDHMAEWQAVPHTPSMAGERMTVVIEVAGAAQFFRLYKP